MIRAYLELFAGGAACALALMGGASVVPPVGYMGGKRRLAPNILGAAGLRVGGRAERVLLCDAGLWGEVWSEVVRDAPGLAARLIAWEGRDPSELWRSLAMAPRPEDPQERAAAYLWLQGRAASCTPVWWDTDGHASMARSASSGGGEQRIVDRLAAGQASPPQCVLKPVAEKGRIVMPSNGARGPGVIGAHEPDRLVMPDKPGTTGDAVQRSTGSRSATSGIARPSTVALRILAAGRALAGARIDRQHPTAIEVSIWLGTPGDLSGVVVMLDPPYVGATRYEATCPREDVVALAYSYRACGATVIVCEAEALPELLALGWHGLDLRDGQAGKPEWLTCSHPPHHLARPQLALPLRRSA